MSCNPFGLLCSGLLWAGLVLALATATEKLIKAKGLPQEQSLPHSLPLWQVIRVRCCRVACLISSPSSPCADICIFRFQSQHNKSRLNLNLGHASSCPTLILMHDNIAEIFVKKFTSPPPPSLHVLIE